MSTTSSSSEGGQLQAHSRHQSERHGVCELQARAAISPTAASALLGAQPFLTTVAELEMWKRTGEISLNQC
jgi:hypothetical protein